MFNGRYGSDKLNRTLIFGAVALTILGSFSSLIFPEADMLRLCLAAVAITAIIIALLRMFSLNIAARRRELDGFLNLIRRIKAWFHGVRRTLSHVKPRRPPSRRPSSGHSSSRRTPLKGRLRFAHTFEEWKKYKIFSCPLCMQRLRVPRHKGRLRVTCTKCRCKFEVRS